MPSAAIPGTTPGFRPFAGSLRRLAGLAAALRRLGRRVAGRRLPDRRLAPTRLQRDELMAMSSHELSDLGIGRSEIPALFGERSPWRAGR
jgi:uncharacterized protein YjiS (DUF1127 family)